MFKTQYLGIALALLPLAGCDPSKIADSDSSSNEIKTCTEDGTCQNTNCDDINQPDQGPGSEFSMPNPDVLTSRYKLTAFYPDASRVWHVRGFHVTQDFHRTHTPADGLIRSMRVNGVDVIFDSMKVNQTDLTLSYCPSVGCTGSNTQTLSGASLVGTQLVIYVPAATGSGPASYTLTFNSAPQTLDRVTPSSNDVVGYSLSYALNHIDGTLGTAASLCMGPNNDAQRALFYQSAYWNPETFAKTGDSTGTTLTSAAVTVTCELGAIAACMSWGYKPWEETTSPEGHQTKEKWHTTCINAKTANYCGDGQAWTKYGTHILVQDPLDPHMMNEMPNPNSNYKVEALWTEKGASCVNDANRRIPSLHWNKASCYRSMRACDSSINLSQNFATGIP